MNATLTRYLYLTAGIANVCSWIFFDGAYDTVTKPLLMPLLMLYLYQRSEGRVILDSLILFAALVFSWLGDLALMLEGYFLAGVGSFFIAQLLYIRLFYQHHTPWNTWMNWKSNVILLYGLGLLWLLLPNAGALTVPVAIYGISLVSMSIFAVNSGANDRRAFLLGVVGSVLFVISDSLIALDKFMVPLDHRSVWVMTTYIAAQYLLVEGLILRIKN